MFGRKDWAAGGEKDEAGGLLPFYPSLGEVTQGSANLRDASSRELERCGAETIRANRGESAMQPEAPTFTPEELQGLVCGFCGKHRDLVNQITVGLTQQATICNECVDTCAELIHGEPQE